MNAPYAQVIQNTIPASCSGAMKGSPQPKLFTQPRTSDQPVVAVHAEHHVGATADDGHREIRVGVVPPEAEILDDFAADRLVPADGRIVVGRRHDHGTSGPCTRGSLGRGRLAAPSAMTVATLKSALKCS